MQLTPDTAAILVADRRSARQHTADRRRSILDRFRRNAATTGAPATVDLTDGRSTARGPVVDRPQPTPAGRTPSGVAA